METGNAHVPLPLAQLIDDSRLIPFKAGFPSLSIGRSFCNVLAWPMRSSPSSLLMSDADALASSLWSSGKEIPLPSEPVQSGLAISLAVSTKKIFLKLRALAFNAARVGAFRESQYNRTSRSSFIAHKIRRWYDIFGVGAFGVAALLLPDFDADAFFPGLSRWVYPSIPEAGGWLQARLHDHRSFG